jgi:glutamyl-tRNA reductase
MTFSTIGINHHHANVDWRERLAVPAQYVQERVRALVREASREAFILSTCNRTEIYCAQANVSEVLHTFLQQQGLDHNQSFDRLIYRLDHQATIHHLFRVASGLDSMVLGETQILGQLKEAFRMAQQAGSLGQHLNLLIQYALYVAKDVRTQTSLGSHQVSMPSAAIELIQRIFPSWSEVRVLLVGAGTMNRSFGRALWARNPAQLTIVNRSLDRGQALSKDLNSSDIEVYPLELLASTLSDADVVVCCTSSPVPILGKGMIEAAQKHRRHRPMILLDLGVPRNIEPEIHNLRDVFLYTVDDLGQWIEHGQKKRQVNAIEAEQLIDAYVRRFMSSYQQRQLQQRSLKTLHLHGQSIRDHAVHQAQQRLARGHSSEEVVQWLGHTLTQRLLHQPSEWIKQQEYPVDFNL